MGSYNLIKEIVKELLISRDNNGLIKEIVKELLISRDNDGIIEEAVKDMKSNGLEN